MNKEPQTLNNVPNWAAADYALGHSIDSIMSWTDDNHPWVSTLELVLEEINRRYELDNPFNCIRSDWDAYWHVARLLDNAHKSPDLPF